MKKRYLRWFVLWLPLLIGILLIVLRPQLSGSTADALSGFTQAKPFISPNGKWALLDAGTQNGEVLLYSVGQQKVVKRFAPGYAVPLVGAHMWSHDSNRFLLIRYMESAKAFTYEVWHPETLEVQRLELKGDWQGLKASLSPNGRYIVAETDQGVLLWDSQASGNSSRIIKLDLSDLVDLAQFSWIGSEQVLLRLGYQKPRLVLIDVGTRNTQWLSVSAEGPMSLPACSPLVEKVPVLTNNPPQKFAWLILKTGQIEKQSSISLNKADPSDSEVQVQNDSSWKWFLSCGNAHLPVLWRWRKNGLVELVRGDLQTGKLGTVFETQSLGLPSIDMQGRIWMWAGKEIKLVGVLQ